jgi:hypothetical protein
LHSIFWLWVQLWQNLTKNKTNKKLDWNDNLIKFKKRPKYRGSHLIKLVITLKGYKCKVYLERKYFCLPFYTVHAYKYYSLNHLLRVYIIQCVCMVYCEHKHLILQFMVWFITSFNLFEFFFASRGRLYVKTLCI